MRRSRRGPAALVLPLAAAPPGGGRPGTGRRRTGAVEVAPAEPVTLLPGQE
ncbi:hypothetical protein ACIRTB_26460 [Streptomyces sp. NPDC101158]|uniref:hypothetical protein n=1 Tax=Streptomyces sp. NPDC101158 TaxID=3366117 RepID=UPI0037FC1D46